jgi:hypothetical protein
MEQQNQPIAGMQDDLNLVQEISVEELAVREEYAACHTEKPE